MYGTLVTVAKGELVGDIVVPVALLELVELRVVLLAELLAAFDAGMVADGEDVIEDDEEEDVVVDDRTVEVAVPADITVTVNVVVCAATS